MTDKATAEDARKLKLLLERAEKLHLIHAFLFTLFLPPLAVYLHGGDGMEKHIVLNFLLLPIFWVPATLHAIWYSFVRDRRQVLQERNRG
ncbi:Protein F47B7.1 [Aphelenchoides avenae]|nr:Protein F47B7.1 [Aphelenchus avenae]